MEFTVVAKVVLQETGRPLPGVAVALYDRDVHSADDLLGTRHTDQHGLALFEFDTEDFADRWGVFDDAAAPFPTFDREPDLYLVVYDTAGQPVVSTREQTQEAAPRTTALTVALSEAEARQAGAL